MKGNQTFLTDPDDGDVKTFAYDYSYWSHDGGRERADGYWEAEPGHAREEQYCDQTKAFDDLGRGILKNAWEGYNSTLFAYGQTGSGKSYSVVGYGPNKGIVPLFCEAIFKEIGDKKKTADASAKYEVTFSMLEIYNEIVRDLLNPKNNKKGGLRVRQHKKKGFWPEGLTVVPVDSYEAISRKMEEGTTQRTIASTNMNSTSSRAHTIVAITFVQKTKNATGEEFAKTSVTNLVDLAGSERVANTGASGDRLKEGAAINQSLSSLGNVIAALADQSNGKNVRVPYRDSVLTKLLQNALGGNSKTIMIAAISPADINFAESLSTLRYADRAKQIKTRARVNEDPTAKLIRELQEENARLKGLSGGGGAGGGGRKGGKSGDLSADQEAELKERLAENEREMEEMRRSFEERVQQQQTTDATATGGIKSSSELQRQRAKYPHFYNLNMDPQMNAMIVHVIKSGRYKIGNAKGAKSDIALRGPSILEQHGIITSSKDHMDVQLGKATDAAKITVNGVPVTSTPVELHHCDRVLFGTTQMYVFGNPIEQKKLGSAPVEVDWEMAQQEIAANSGLTTGGHAFGGDMSPAELELQEKLLDLMPAIEEANSISESLDQMCKFELLMVSPEQFGRPKGSTELFVRVRNFGNGLQYNWPEEKFRNRFFKMQELYEDVEEGDADMRQLPDDQNPFTEPIDQPVRIGACSMYPKCLAYQMPLKCQMQVTDLRAAEVGLLDVELMPCDAKGKEHGNQSDTWIDDPKELIGRDLYCKLRIAQAWGLPPRFTDIQCRYLFHNEPDYHETDLIGNTSNPRFDHEQRYHIKSVTLEDLKFILDGRILIELFGIQMPIQRDQRDKRNTRALMQADTLSKGQISAANTNERVVDMGRARDGLEAEVLRKRHEQLDTKLRYLREMVKIGESKGVDAVPLNYIKGVLEAPSGKVLDQWADMYKHSATNGAVTGRSSSANRIGSSSTCTIQ